MRPRLASLDALRGAVMILMALDHTRDFIHAGAMSFSPTDLTRTTALLFFTRWVTHFCLPVFLFTAGAGAFLFGHSRGIATLSRYLWTRGLWFILLELTVMQVAYNFNFSSPPMILLLILWVFGICMVAMAALVHLPIRLLAWASVGILAFHDCLDGIQARQFGAGSWVWNLLHQPGVFVMGGKPVLSSYPFLPWIAVLGAGYCFGFVLLWEAEARRRLLLRLGTSLTLAFVLVRGVNRYGDPSPWVHQSSGLFTVLSFLNCTKYPASLDFLLMTLGPAFLLWAHLDQRRFPASHPLLVFGRVPLFYFVSHFYLIHALVVAAAWLRYGRAAATFVFHPLPSMGGPRALFPADFGYDLWAVYGFWILTLVLLYPMCRWFGKKKASGGAWWWGYL